MTIKRTTNGNSKQPSQAAAPLNHEQKQPAVKLDVSTAAAIRSTLLGTFRPGEQKLECLTRVKVAFAIFASAAKDTLSEALDRKKAGIEARTSQAVRLSEFNTLRRARGVMGAEQCATFMQSCESWPDTLKAARAILASATETKKIAGANAIASALYETEDERAEAVQKLLAHAKAERDAKNDPVANMAKRLVKSKGSILAAVQYVNAVRDHLVAMNKQAAAVIVNAKPKAARPKQAQPPVALAA